MKRIFISTTITLLFVQCNPYKTFLSKEKQVESKKDYALRRGQYKTIADAMQLGNNDTVCDIGAGAGFSISILAEFLPATTVYYEEDINQKLCNKQSFKNTFEFYQSNANINQFKFFKGKEDKIPFADESFSNIVVFLCLHEFTKLPAMMQELKRILRKNGHLFILESVYTQTPATDPYCKLPYLSEKAVTELMAKNQLQIVKDISINGKVNEDNGYGRFMVCKK
jgi:ubiquinone/menaquinone biosynthesis C-methylase UbiE